MAVYVLLNAVVHKFPVIVENPIKLLFTKDKLVTVRTNKLIGDGAQNRKQV